MKKNCLLLIRKNCFRGKLKPVPWITVFFLFTSISPILASAHSLEVSINKEEYRSANIDGDMVQTREIKGKVVDDKGEAIPGVSIVLKGKVNVGTSTDVNGEFTINVDSENDILIFSFIGMKTQEIPVGANNFLTVNLAPEVETLEEIVVVAYGTQKKGSLTGAITVLKSEELAKSPAMSLNQTLQGKVAGLQVVQSNGLVGEMPYIQIRGTGSLAASNSPLFVIDGMPTPAADFRSINPNDIESVSILKDASSASLYGSRASNGVILITTKRGKSGKTAFNVSITEGFSTLTNTKFRMMNSRELIDWEILVGKRQANDPNIAADLANDHSWIKDLTQTGRNRSYDISVSSGNETTKFYTSMAYLKQGGIVKSNDLNRFTIKSNVDHKINKYLNMGLSLTFGKTQRTPVNQALSGTNPLICMYMNRPYNPVRNPDGTWADTHWGWQNPLEHLENLTLKYNDYKGMGSAFLEITPIKDLSVKEMVGLDMTETEYSEFLQPDSRNVQLGNAPSRLINSSERKQSYTSITTATYNKAINNHEVKVIAGFEVQSYRNKSMLAQGRNLPSDQTTVLNAAATPFATTGGAGGWGLVSYLTNFHYNYKVKYLIDATIRRDGCSRFGKDVRYGNFWSIGAGWNLHMEEFIKNISIINQLKLRASWGTSGNFEIGDFASLTTIAYSKYMDKNTSYLYQIGNSELTWEKNNIKALGLDYAILNNRIKGKLDLYNRVTKDLLQWEPMNSSSGFYSILRNVGSIQNKGIEFTVDAEIIKSDGFGYSFGFSISHNNSKVLKLSDGKDVQTDGTTLLREGEKPYAFFLVKYAGVNPSNGEPLFYTKDGKVTNVYSSNDLVMTNKSNDPVYFGTVSNELTYKNISLSASLYYSLGNYVYNGILEVIQGDGQEQGNQAVEALTHSWHKPGDIVEIPKQDLNIPRAPGTTRELENASFIRLTDVTLSYSIPEKWFGKQHKKSVKVYAKGMNLWTYTKFSGIDPELYYGPWNFRIPPSRIINFGIDISF
ncbi:MAG: TonB-dependent receptor [Bacteroidales bacterium]|nr:MAG: TonB-dependent receptor [Bacteroidales bacterium]